MCMYIVMSICTLNRNVEKFRSFFAFSLPFLEFLRCTDEGRNLYSFECFKASIRMWAKCGLLIHMKRNNTATNNGQIY